MLVGQHRKLDPLSAAEVGGVARGCLADQDERNAGGLEVGAGAVQLHRVVAAVSSAVVAEPDQGDGAVAPEVAEANAVALVVGKDDVGQRVGPLWRLRALPVLAHPEYCEECTVQPMPGFRAFEEPRPIGRVPELLA
jgi:hypothetical protein